MSPWFLLVAFALGFWWCWALLGGRLQRQTERIRVLRKELSEARLAYLVDYLGSDAPVEDVGP